MIDSISTVSVQSAVLRQQPQEATNAATPVSAIKAPELSTSRIRVDNLQNVAILEVISKEGDVVRQYPTESQIEAFKRANSLVSASDNKVSQGTPQSDVTGDTVKSGASFRHFAASDSDTETVAPAKARQSVAPQTYAPSGPTNGTGASTQSLIA